MQNGVNMIFYLGVPELNHCAKSVKKSNHASPLQLIFLDSKVLPSENKIKQIK